MVVGVFLARTTITAAKVVGAAAGAVGVVGVVAAVVAAAGDVEAVAQSSDGPAFSSGKDSKRGAVSLLWGRFTLNPSL